MLKHNINFNKNTGSDTEATKVDQYTSYVIDGKHFDVERVFNESANDSLGMVLLKLIKTEIAPF